VIGVDHAFMKAAMMAASQPWGHMAVWKEEPLALHTHMLPFASPSLKPTHRHTT